MAQERIPLTAVIVDDGGYGMLRYDQNVTGAERYGVDLKTPDFAALAGAFGVRAETVDGLDDEFGEALAAHVADPEPSVLVGARPNRSTRRPTRRRTGTAAGTDGGVGREQALAFRLAAHHLHERLPAGSEPEAAAVIGLQDFPPGLAPVALAARVADADMDALTIVYAWRGAAVAVPRADVRVFTTGLAPPDDGAARTLIGTAVESLDPEGISATDALDRVSAAVADALAAGPLERDDFHQALRERLPGELLRWCRGCQSHHVHPSLWRATGVRGVLAVAERRGRVTVFGAPPGPRGQGRARRARAPLLPCLRTRDALRAGRLGRNRPGARARAARPRRR